MRRWLRWSPLPVALAVAAAGLLLGLRGAFPASDFALLELATDEASRGERLLGPYSRLRWHHPGPAYFHLLAPIYLVTGRSSAALPLGALLINVAAMLGIVTLLGRWCGGRAGAVAALASMLAFGAYLGPGFAHDVWNPHVTVLPLGLLLVLAAGMAGGSGAALPAAVAVASFLVQTHVAYLPCALAALAVGAGLGRGWTGRHLATAAGVVALFWALPVYEQVTGEPGNLTKLLEFFGRAAGRHTFAEAAAIIAREIAWPVAWLAAGARDNHGAPAPLAGAVRVAAGLFTLAQLALLAWSSWRDRDRPFLRALSLACLLGAVVAVPAVMRIDSEHRPYLTAWISVVGAVGLAAVLARALARRDRPVGVAWPEVAAAALAVPVALQAFGVRLASEFPDAAALADVVGGGLAAAGARRPQVRPGGDHVFFRASAVLLQLHRRGHGFAVDAGWRHMFGARWWTNGDEDARLVFGDAPLPGGPPPLVCRRYGAQQFCVTLAGATLPPP